jgi:hypothetical protein
MTKSATSLLAQASRHLFLQSLPEAPSMRNSHPNVPLDDELQLQAHASHPRLQELLEYGLSHHGGKSVHHFYAVVNHAVEVFVHETLPYPTQDFDSIVSFGRRLDLTAQIIGKVTNRFRVQDTSLQNDAQTPVPRNLEGGKGLTHPSLQPTEGNAAECRGVAEVFDIPQASEAGTPCQTGKAKQRSAPRKPVVANKSLLLLPDLLMPGQARPTSEAPVTTTADFQRRFSDELKFADLMLAQKARISRADTKKAG